MVFERGYFNLHRVKVAKNFMVCK